MKRLRVFAGPNGSGKSTFFEFYKEQFNPGIFINADVIEKSLNQNGILDFSSLGVEILKSDWLNFIESNENQLILHKIQDKLSLYEMQFEEQCIKVTSTIENSYTASLIASFFRKTLNNLGKSYSFETVLSHQGKLEEIKLAKKNGFKIYLYFICLVDVAINISRIANRVEKGGHHVPSDKVISRYGRTLDNMIKLLELCDKVYLFDNSSVEFKLLASIENRQMTTHIDSDNVPTWFADRFNLILKNI